jgi:hypothetical protein
MFIANNKPAKGEPMSINIRFRNGIGRDQLIDRIIDNSPNGKNPPFNAGPSPLPFSPAAGLLNEFRTVDGSGNNRLHPERNPVAGSDEVRFTRPLFMPGTADGLIDGPNPRTISNAVSSGPHAEDHDPKLSAWSYVFGQFVDHDLDLTNQDGVRHIDIAVPNGDPNLPDGSVIPLTRAMVDPGNGHAINAVSGWLDASQVYGSDSATAQSLRLPDGHMKTSEGNNLPIVNDQFVAGDVRVMENPELTGATLLFVREHNYQVDRLHALHPNWTGDQLYQMAKAIVTAELENIIYSEFLPALLGNNALPAYHGYNPNADARITEEFSMAAFRFGHSTVSGEQTKIDNQGNELATQSLADAFLNTPADDTANGGLDALLRNLGADPAQANDVYAVDELRNLLAAPPDAIDLIAIDVQRERDLGLNTLNKTRAALGLAPYTSFTQVTSDPTIVVAHLQQTYGTVDKLDLFIGGLAEKHVPGADMGQTFRAILARQFENLRDGDRFWWQNENFDPATRTMIGQTTLSDLIMRNTDTKDMQLNAFVTAQRHLSSVAPEDPSSPQLVIGVDTPGATIAGGAADDTIVAGLGSHQRLTGAGGTDLFVFDGTGHVDTITDFNPRMERIEFHVDAADLLPATVRNTPGGATVGFDGNSITLSGVAAGQITQNNLIFLDSHAQVSHHPLLFR